MKDEEKQQVLAYVDQFSDIFNGMMKEVSNRIVNDNIGYDTTDFFSKQDSKPDITSQIRLDPKKFVDHQQAFMEKQQQLLQNASRAFMGEKFDTVIEEKKGDKRFSDEDWQGNPGFNYIRQAYLLNAEYLHQLVDCMEFEEKSVKEQVRFFTRQYVNSMSPSNYVLTNPEVCREILETKGDSLAKGIDNFMRDLESSPKEAFKITQVARDAFTLGKDLATTPGKVVFQNALLQLIQYQASTEDVFETPLLIVPPFINKFYILDLTQQKSLVRWLTEQGHTVFMISWVNPDESLRELDFDTYITGGVLAAVNVIKQICSVNEVNAVGYCVGGTVLGMTQAYLAAKGEKSLRSISLFTTLFDYSEPGEVGAYLSDKIIPLVEQSVTSKGYLDGRILALSFSLLRENNLFWSFFIENYLKGKDPIPFDILYWNSDSTNMPAKAFLYYLKTMYLDNKLVEPGAVSVDATPICLGDITVPSYCLAAQADHIVLWQSAYTSAKCLAGDVRFVLTESGHVAGVVNPAERGKYPYWVNDSLAGDAGEWLAGATQEAGSWWMDWQRWFEKQSMDRVKARKVGSTKQYPALENAPGSYVNKRLDTV